MGDPSQDPIGELPPIENPNRPNADEDSPQEDALLSDLDSICVSCVDLQSRSVAAVETIEDLRNQNQNLSKTLDEISKERDELRIKIVELEASYGDREEANLKERFELETQIELFTARVSEILEEKTRRDEVLNETLELVRSAKEVLRKIRDRISKDQIAGNLEEKSNFDDKLEILSVEAKSIHQMSLDLGSGFSEYEETTRKEKKQLENSIVSLTEENRDVNSLLRVALVEKEALEKSLSRMKGAGEQKKLAILQIAGRGLQKVGLGFMIGEMAGEPHCDQPSNSDTSTKSDGSGCEEEVVSLASTVEKIMKNLHLEISTLKRSLDESRSDGERLQTFVDQQAEKIKENTLYINELEEKENMLAQNVEELTSNMTEAQKEVARWREACELEVETAKLVIEERDKEIAMLQNVLERTNYALETANRKLMLKERLAATAMAAQAAAEASLQLADSRSSVLRERIEELMKQVEEGADDRSKKERSGSSRRKLRHVCWPWRALKLTPASRPGVGGGGGGGSVASWVGTRNRRMMPEMEALLHLI